MAIQIILAGACVIAFVTTIVVALYSIHESQLIGVRLPGRAGLREICLRWTPGEMELSLRRSAQFNGERWVSPAGPATPWFFSIPAAPVRYDRFGQSKSIGPIELFGGSIELPDAPGGTLGISQYGIAMSFWCWMILSGVPAGYLVLSIRRNWRGGAARRDSKNASAGGEPAATVA